jgi:lipopolysaccharide export system protein LptC
MYNNKQINTCHLHKIVTNLIKSNMNGLQLQINCNATMTKLKEQKKTQYQCKEHILCDGTKHVKFICIRWWYY